MSSFVVFPCIEDVEEGDNNEVESNTYGNADKADEVEDTEEEVEEYANEANEVQDMEEQVEEMEQEVEEMEQETEDVNGGEEAADDIGKLIGL